MLKRNSPKSTAIELEERVNAIRALMLRGESRSAICEFGRKKWGVTPKTCDDYVSRVRTSMLAEIQGERENMLAEEIAVRNDLYLKCYAEKKYAFCLEIARDRSKLLGLYEPIAPQQNQQPIVINFATTEASADIAESEEV